MRRYSDELYHFGIKGMKWGVRKDRNKRAYNRARRLVDRADRGKSPLMSLARKLGKARAKAGLHSPRDKRIITKEWRTIRDKEYSARLKTDKGYLKACDSCDKALSRMQKARSQYYFKNSTEENWKKVESTRNDYIDASANIGKHMDRIMQESKKVASDRCVKKYGYDPGKGNPKIPNLRP